MIAVIAALNVYPVKSAAGVPLAEADMTPDGLRHDRAFMLVRPDGRHLSQREVPALALVHPAYDGVKLTVSSPLADAPLICEAADGPPRDVTVHRRPCQGIDQGDDAAGWFSDALGLPCRLVRFTGTRPTMRGGGTLAYADGYPVSVRSQESLDDLNRRTAGPLPMNRFRPNILLSGLGPYGEDGVTRLRGAAEIELIRPCGRCVIVNTDQETGERSPATLRALATYRTGRFDGAREIVFGRLGVPRALGTLRVGDELTAS
ncbi:MOSC domain-containing protein [Actinomadura nitritigenes]|uniref:MOSC N-terminal beta barrel domain-containing protein n=1 Tax=Actinomadura nitritigenes TaxID=134602 RepID=A0ABS3QS82_9ACTN|nr:MOSC N-terminal beta barrel domain-containing protein [Actinomadura nitritigenes]MBO2436829.1 MOSC N-terminal beta barrel domain-containing protein [Actinomadura nitritigenes]